MRAEQRESFERDGFFVVPAFCETSALREMQKSVDEIAIATNGGGTLGPALVQPETAFRASGLPPEKRVSKVFRIHRQVPVFRRFCCDARLLDLVEALLGPDLDCFLSQFIYKQPRALGQPWHQDSYYFPFDRTPQVGAWLAVTEARLENGPLWVLPGSHKDPIHPVVRDRREHANLGYVEIVGRDTSGAVPVLMQAGDLLLFHSHLMHCSTDNEASDLRAAMVYHYAEAGTQDFTEQKFGYKSPNSDWLPVRRAAA